MMRTVAVGAFAMLLSAAPVQCPRDPDPSLRREDTAGDALWALAQEFRAKQDDKAAADTLRFLIERYPSNRHAAAARELVRHTDGGT